MFLDVHAFFDCQILIITLPNNIQIISIDKYKEVILASLLIIVLIVFLASFAYKTAI